MSYVAFRRHPRRASFIAVIRHAFCCCAAILVIAPAAASQGPGASPGTASPTLQVAMALLVYGLSFGVVIAGLIGLARRR
ncbi:hypothetical protein [Rhodopseudomonas sp. B29]|uniref:hypothetical protein n=1 Tax=Rhodopseudomonas sp. B29 TaxID=95607 RepID=UPI0003476E4F|nr:hypothetical protein [Rhodopseudomonas sp. B29]